MASNNPYDEGIFPDQPAAPAPTPPVSNPYDVLPTPIGPEASAVTRAADKPYSAFNTAGRMATDAPGRHSRHHHRDPARDKHWLQSRT